MRFLDTEEVLRLEYNDHEEDIDHQNVIAVIEHDDKVGGQLPGEHSSILQVLKKDSKYSFDSISIQGKLPVSFLQRHLLPARPPHLGPPEADGNPSLRVVVSTRAGLGKAGDFFFNVVSLALASYGYQDEHYRVHFTKTENDVSTLAQGFLRDAEDGVEQTILLLSGDGAVVDFVNVFQSRQSDAKLDHRYVKPVIGLIALGTGNALANSTGINSDGTLGLRHFFRGSPKRLPTFVANFAPGSEYLVDEGRSTEPLPLIHDDKDEDHCTIYGAVVCSWGLHASLVADSDTTEYRKFGSERFQMAAKELLGPSDGSPPHIYSGRITLLGDDSKGLKAVPLDRKEHTYVLATLVSNLEQNLKISPRSKPLDSQMRLVHFGPMPSTKVHEILGKAFTDASHIDDEAVGYEEIHGLRIDFKEEEDRWRRVCVDGKIVNVSKNGWVEVTMCKNAYLYLLL